MLSEGFIFLAYDFRRRAVGHLELEEDNSSDNKKRLVNTAVCRVGDHLFFLSLAVITDMYHRYFH